MKIDITQKYDIWMLFEEKFGVFQSKIKVVIIYCRRPGRNVTKNTVSHKKAKHCAKPMFNFSIKYYIVWDLRQTACFFTICLKFLRGLNHRLVRYTRL